MVWNTGLNIRHMDHVDISSLWLKVFINISNAVTWKRDKSKNYLCGKGAYSQPGFRLHMYML
jgi:hypothetical protein